MMRTMFKRTFAGAMLMGLLIPLLAACGGQAEPQVIRETVVVRETVEPQIIEQTVIVEAPTAEEGATEEGAEEPAASTESYTTPHPILDDLRVRQAIAYCADRSEVAKSVYSFLDDEQREELLMDTFLPKTHWAAAGEDDGITVYPFDPEQGQALLDEAGWTLDEGDTVRMNEAGEPLTLKFTTTNAQFRQTWAAVFEQQLLDNCGIQIIRTHAPGSWWFGGTTGLQRRDFELGAFAWVGETDPKGQTLYACNQIPLPSNSWEGQNYMGWCNETASQAIIAANNTLDRDERIAQYQIFQQEFTKDMPSLPMFNRLEVAAASGNVENYNPDPTEYYTKNIYEWTLTDGGDTVVLGMTQEPASMFTQNESAAVQRIAAYLIGNFGHQGFAFTAADYDYQALALTELPSIENGGAALEAVEVNAGDMVWSVDGDAVELADGVEVINADGETVAFEGDAITMNQLSVTFEYQEGITWEDGEPLKAADFELGNAIECDPEAGTISLQICNSRQEIEYVSDNSYTITYLPGVQWPEYSVYSLYAYPSHQELSDGRTLADVPADEWSSLPEIAEAPLSLGPYRLVEWEKGQRMVFEANPNYYGGEPAIQNVIIQFFEDTNQAVAQLLTGDVDVLGRETLGAGPEVEAVLQEAEEGTDLQVFTLASPTWEHVDINLFTK